MKRLTCFSLLMLLLVIDVGQAQGPPAPMQDPFLDNFVGDWRVERKMGSGKTVQTSVHVEWVLRHQFIEFHYGGSATPAEYEAFVFIGFDGAAKNYVCHWMDVFGGSSSELGLGKIDDKLKAIEFRFGSELTNKFTFDPQTKTWTSLIRQVEKGEWKTFAEEKWTKK